MGIVIIIIAVLAIIGLAYLLDRKPKPTMVALIGICSIMAFIPLIPLVGIFAHTEEMSLAKHAGSIVSTVIVFAVALIICAIAYFILTISCVSVIIKSSNSNVKSDNLKNFKRTFFASGLVSFVTIIIMALSSIIEVAFGKRIVEFMFSLWDSPLKSGASQTMITLEYICSFLILFFSISSLALCKIDKSVKPDDIPKKLSNRIFLSVTCLVLLFVSILPVYNSYYNMWQYLYARFLVVFAGIVMLFLIGFSVIINSGANPEKVQKILKRTFYVIVLISIIILIDNIIIGIMFSILFSLLSLGLAALGIFLVMKSQIVSVDKQNVKNAQNREAAKKTIENINEGVVAGVKAGVITSAEFAKENAPIVKGYLQKIIAVYKSVFPRITGILSSSKTEYQLIAKENKPVKEIFTLYLLPLTALVALAAFIGWGFIGYSYFGEHYRIVGDGVKMAIAQFVLLAGSIFITASVIYLLAENFGSRKNFDKAFALVLYACTPSLIGGLFHLIPKISWMALLCSLYSFYLLYLGFKPLLQTPEEKKTSFSVISILTLIVVSIVIQRLVRTVLNIDVFDSLVW